MLRPHEIYVRASYLMKGTHGVIVVTGVNATHVDYRAETGMMVGSCPIEMFCERAERVFPGHPQVGDVIELLRRMAPEQRAEVFAHYSESGRFP